MDHAHFMGVLPRKAIALSVVFENTPRIVGPRCSVIENVGEGLWHVVARFGFFEIPDLTIGARSAAGPRWGCRFRRGGVRRRPRSRRVQAARPRAAGLAHRAVRIPIPQLGENSGPLQSAAGTSDRNREANRNLAASCAAHILPRESKSVAPAAHGELALRYRYSLGESRSDIAGTARKSRAIKSCNTLSSPTTSRRQNPKISTKEMK